MIRPVSKSGLSVIECVVALSVLAVMLTTLLSIHVVQSARLGLAKHQLTAEQTLNNLAQRIQSADVDTVTQQAIDQWADAQEKELELPPEMLHADVQVITEPASGVRIDLTWNPKSPKLPEYSLTVWRFKKAMEETAEASP